ncbi:PREDICTED: uncharacterized protein LOC105566227 [Vollenhovia emeryi]|uniref:uncharacterized protein LOC105566227 n=1 Tax=Vollenhovia emeryi TaxID=411798 RepID=UPI0005F5380C|nr:PREDICTED: uncharacterized protein LOC105566227 [Vollenhovia emeryi]XP_011875458.1 PREDICTED: uncharacterized protein LOC105566227 [Vollenhovia emeryi]
MEDIELFIKVVQQKRLANQHELDRLDAEPKEHKKFMKELRGLQKEREQCKKNIAKHLGTITSQKHSIHKIVHSTKDVSGLPVPHDYAQDMKTMFVDATEFLNKADGIHKAFANVKENNVDPLSLIRDVTTCTETVENKLYQTKCSIAQLETLKGNIAALQQHILNSSNSTNDENVSLDIFNGDSMDSESTIEQ